LNRQALDEFQKVLMLNGEHRNVLAKESEAEQLLLLGDLPASLAAFNELENLMQNDKSPNKRELITRAKWRQAEVLFAQSNFIVSSRRMNEALQTSGEPKPLDLRGLFRLGQMHHLHCRIRLRMHHAHQAASSSKAKARSKYRSVLEAIEAEKGSWWHQTKILVKDWFAQNRMPELKATVQDALKDLENLRPSVTVEPAAPIPINPNVTSPIPPAPRSRLRKQQHWRYWRASHSTTRPSA